MDYLTVKKAVNNGMCLAEWVTIYCNAEKIDGAVKNTGKFFM